MRRRLCTAGLVVLASLVVWVAPVLAVDQPPTIVGNTLSGSYSSSQPFYDAGLDFSSNPNLAAHVVGLSCSAGGLRKPKAGPNGADECDYQTPVTNATYEYQFDTDPFSACKCSTFVAQSFGSLNHQTYVNWASFTLNAPVAPAPTPAPKSQPDATPKRTTNDSGTNLDWLWVVLLVVGITGVGGGVVLARRRNNDSSIAPHECTNAIAEVAAAEQAVKDITSEADAHYRGTGDLRLEGAILSQDPDSTDDADEKELSKRLRAADARLTRAREALKRCQAGGPDFDPNSPVDPNPPTFDPTPPSDPDAPDPGQQRQEIG